MKILIDETNGKQSLISVFENGAYNGDGTIIWSEETDGAMSAITLGAMIRVGDALQVDAARQATHDAVIATEVAERTRLNDIDTAIKGDAAFNAFKAKTNAEQNAWWAGATTAVKWQAVLWILKWIARRG